MPDQIRIADGDHAANFKLDDPRPVITLSSLFGHDVPREEVVKAARAFVDARRGKEAAEEALKMASAIEQQSETALLQMMNAQGMKSLKIDHDGTVTITATKHAYYSLPSGSLDDTDIYRWLLRSGGHDMAKRTIHHATFNSFCRELAVQGKGIHPSVKKVETERVQLRRG